MFTLYMSNNNKINQINIVIIFYKNEHRTNSIFFNNTTNTNNDNINYICPTSNIYMDTSLVDVYVTDNNDNKYTYSKRKYDIVQTLMVIKKLKNNNVLLRI